MESLMMERKRVEKSTQQFSKTLKGFADELISSRERIKTLESAMQELVDGVDDIEYSSATQLEQWLVRTADIFKHLLRGK